MADDSAERIELSLSIVEGMAAVGRAEWNAVANPSGEPYDPFLDWDFLEALEASGCAAPDTGWGPRHILAHDGAGQAGRRRATLHQVAFARRVRVRPCLGRCAAPRRRSVLSQAALRRAVHAGDGAPAAGSAGTAAGGDPARRWREPAWRLAADARVSSVHFNFLEEPSWRALGEEGLLLREDQQFHWINRGYKTFDDFLAALASRKRKMLRRERREAQEGLTIERITGADLTKKHWDAFFRFYMDTGGRKWGSPYLNREFFALLHERMADKCLLVLAMDGTRPIAGALNMIGSDTLYGRYWGRIDERPFLHFEVCYYQAIDFAIERGLGRGGSRGARRAQAGARLRAYADALGALDRTCRIARCRCEISRQGARGGRGRH